MRLDKMIGVWQRRLACVAGLIVLPSLLGAQDGAVEVSQLQAMMEEMRALFASSGSRAPGFPGNRALEAEVAKRFANSGFKNGALSFTTPVLVPGKTTLSLASEPAVPLYVMHPTMYRPGNFSEDEFVTGLVYLGKGEPDDLARAKGAKLEGAIALMDFDCGDMWRGLLRFGVKGFVFIGRPDYYYSDSLAKVYNTEVAVPRFFVEAAEGEALKAACLQSISVNVTIQSEPSRYEAGQLKDLWVLIPGTDPELSKELVLFTARMDANSVVPELATGGQDSVNLYLLLKMLDDFTVKRPKRSVLLAAVNAHTQAYLGERILAWHLLADSSGVEKLRGEIAKEMRIARLYSENYGQLKLEQVALDEGKLFAAVELMWQLDAKQQARHLAEQETARARVPVAGAGTNAAAAVSTVQTNIVLDLAGLTEKDYREAADRAIKSMQDQEQGTVVSRQLRDAKMSQALTQERAWVESLKDMSFAEIESIVKQAKSVFDDEKLFESWRVELDVTSGQRLSVKKELQNAALKTKNELLQQRIRLFRDKTLTTEERDRLVAELDAKKADAAKVLVMFNKIDFGIGRRRIRYRSIATHDSQRLLLKGYSDALTQKYSFWQRMHRERLEADAADDAIRAELKGEKVVLAISLEMSGNSDKLAYSYSSPYFEGNWQLNFGKYISGIATNFAANRANGWMPFIDAESVPASSQTALPSFLHSADSAVQVFLAAKNGDQGHGTPAMALKNALASFGQAFSPGDTLDKLNAQRVWAQNNWLREYFPVLLNDPKLMAVENLDVTQLGHGNAFDEKRGLWSILAGTFTLEESTADVVPTKPIADSMMILYDRLGVQPLLVDGDVVNCYANLTDRTGWTIIYSIPDPLGMAPVAYQLSKDSREVLYALDKGRIQSSMQLNSNIERDSSKVLPMFPCREFVMYDRVDPTLVGNAPIAVKTVWPRNGLSKSEPSRYGASGIGLPNNDTVWNHIGSGPAGIYLSDRSRAQTQESLMLITAEKRCDLNASTEIPEGIGYPTPASFGPDFFSQAAKDMNSLNTFRHDRLKGVANSLVEKFLDDGKQALQDMDAAKADKDHTNFILASYRALGSEVKAYLQLADMNNDMLKAIILYMALMLPFCYFIQKLLFDLDKLQHELLAFSICFVIMYLLFRNIHPAFAIAQTPEAIFIAFVLGAVGAFVTMVMHSRFKAEMALIFGKAGGLGKSADYSTVGGTAMMIGIHNMRRRRLRTTLTTATVVLVVFTMLCFSSVSQRLDPTLIRKAADAPYTGLFYHWPAGQNMDEDTANVLKGIFSGRAEVLVRRTKVAFLGLPIEPATGSTNLPYSIKSIVGLPAHDNVFELSMPLLAGKFFSSSEAREIILPSKAAEAMNLRNADVGKKRLKFAGLDLLLVGIADDQRLRLMRDLNPNLPLLPFMEGLNIGGPKKDPASLEIEQDDVSAIVADTASMVLIPATLAGKLGALPHNVSIRFLDEVMADPQFNLCNEFDRLLTITHARFYIGSEKEFKASLKAKKSTRQGVYFVNSNYRTSIGGLARLVIPLLIAGTIILNTMLGTVYERKSEIAIFNAIGLNPTHIFMFFLAEAFVYSFIGSVGGYLIGQSLAMGLQHFHLVKDIGINFSSLMVVYAILFTIGLVLLSTLYPASVATKTAVPSGKRRWDMPKVEDHTMNLAFPFIYEGNLSSGVMYYIYEDFLTCTEKSLSALIATFEGKKLTMDDKGRPVYSLAYAVGLTPFDLGVTQKVTLTAAYEEPVRSYRLKMAIEHVSGLDTNWVVLNKFFLERTRKFLMVWRNMDPALHAWYSECGEKLFKDQPLPKRPGTVD